MTRIMVIDGHARIRELLVELLTAEPGLEVVASAATGDAAVELAHHLRPDVIVIDPDLPGVNGADATGQILIVHSRTHVLVLTAASHGALAAQTLAAGASTCLAKSAPYTTILQAILAATGPGERCNRAGCDAGWREREAMDTDGDGRAAPIPAVEPQ